MSPIALNSADRRTSARIVLFLVVTALSVFLLFAGGPGEGLFAFAQQTPGFSIQWVNPEESTNNEASAKEDGEDDAFHLVAWVSRLPADAQVNFELEDETPIEDDVDQVGEDTFEHFWEDLPEDGTYTLRAELFEGDEEVAEDEIEISVNDEGDPGPLPDGEERAETVEITFPENGGEIGFFTRGDTTAGVIEVSSSADTDEIDVYYSTATPGSDPDFQACGNESAAQAEDGVRCELDEDHDAEDVNAVAAVPLDEEAPVIDPAPDASDAHRADGYQQFPAEVDLVFATGDEDEADGVAPDSCSPLLIATVTDQEGEAVANVDVDSHALGPSDGLKYGSDTGDQATTDFEAPDQNHEDDDEEDAWSCADEDVDGTQNSHNNPDADTKHVEASDGTEDDGEFRFKMFHPEAGTPGSTQVTVWADVDPDDQFCDDEPNDSAAIGWGESADSPEGVEPDEESCTIPGATSTSTSTATSTSTESPTETSTSTSTVSPTETESPSPGPTVDRVPSNVTIRYARGRFRGRVSSERRRCERGRRVRVRKQRRGRDRVVGRDRTNRAGKYSKRKRRARGRHYSQVARKVFTQGNTRVVCLKDRSRTIRVRRRR